MRGEAPWGGWSAWLTGGGVCWGTGGAGVWVAAVLSLQQKPTTCVIDHLRVRIEEFVLEDCQLVVVQVELQRQRPSRSPCRAALERELPLGPEYVIKIHHGSSPVQHLFSRAADNLISMAL